jgi:hypothetical protein
MRWATFIKLFSTGNSELRYVELPERSKLPDEQVAAKLIEQFEITRADLENPAYLGFKVAGFTTELPADFLDGEVIRMNKLIRQYRETISHYEKILWAENGAKARSKSST